MAAIAVVAVVMLLALAEFALRLAGVTDFPTYETDDTIGYIPAPAQSGAFLNKNRWQLNERSMGSGPWQPDGQRDLVLLGDSIVWGGNSLDHPDKLGPQLQAVSGSRWRVWSAAAGSWSVRNQLAYLDRYPDVEAEADALVWVLNTGDLSAEPSRWHSDSTHPRSRPHSALLYVANKYAAPRLGFSTGGGGATASDRFICNFNADGQPSQPTPVSAGCQQAGLGGAVPRHQRTGCAHRSLPPLQASADHGNEWLLCIA